MAGNEFQDKARAVKVDSLTKAVEWVASTQATGSSEYDPPEFTEAMLNALAGRYGSAEAGKTWNGLLCMARELSGTNHGDPSLQVQEQVIGRLFSKLARDAFYAENPERVFAGLSMVKS